MSNHPELLIVDDHAIVRLGIRMLVESNFHGIQIFECEDSKTMLNLLRHQEFTHLILDLQLLDDHAIQHFSFIREHFPHLRILIYSMSSEAVYARRFLKMGAAGFLSKQSNGKIIIDCLNLFFNGRKYISPKIQEDFLLEIPRQKPSESPFETLSERELMVINNLLLGRAPKEIARQLNIKSTTVATYKTRIFDKFGVKNLMELRSIADQFQS